MKFFTFGILFLIIVLFLFISFGITTTIFHGLTRLFKIKNTNFWKSLKVILLFSLAQIFIFLIITGIYIPFNLTKEDVFSSLIFILLSYFAFYFLIKKYYEKTWLKSIGIFVLLLIMTAIINFTLVYCIRSYIVSPFQMYGPGMCDTLGFINGQCQHGYGEYLFVNKISYRFQEPSRGDIIIFHPPQNTSEFFIKRVIGLPGETIELKNGDVYIKNKEHPQGEKLEEPYLNSTNKGNTRPYRLDNTIFEVPSGSYFVMGDNRVASSDSRSCFKENINSNDCYQNGKMPYIQPANIEGKAWIVAWPFNNMRWLENPIY